MSLSVASAMPTFAEELRARSDEELIQLFNLRPDLITPIPADMGALATRATSAPSLIRAIESLNRWQLQVLETTTLFEDSYSVTEVTELTDSAAKTTLEELLALALIYKDGKKFRTPRAVRDILGENIAGLGPTVATTINFKLLDKAPTGAKSLLDQLTWGPPKGQVEDIHKKGSPIQWLLENKFLIPVDSKTVILPREVAIHLRGGKIYKNLSPAQPEVSGKKVAASESDRAAIAAITTLLRLITELLNFWSEETPTAIQSGGLGVREVKKCAEHLGVEEPFAIFIAELTYMLGLISTEPDGRILPNASFDLFQTKSYEEQWLEIVEAWQSSTRVAGLIGRNDSRNITALGPEADRPNAPRIRKSILEIIESASGIAPELDQLTNAVTWRYPHRKTLAVTKDFIAWTTREAEWLGITGAHALSSFGKKFLNGDLKVGLAKALPAPVDHILIQGDNTAIAPGPLTIEISRHLSTFADIESRGGATVYRFSESSIRRGLDHGHSGEEIRSFLKEVSKTPLPQPLDYLITDVSRKHGRLRVGFASAYIRCEDESVITAILKDKKLEHLEIRQIAPQVLIADSEEIIDELRDAGYFPAAENGQGAVMQKPISLRAKTRPKLPRASGDIPAPSNEIMKMAIKTLRTGEQSGRRRPTGEIPKTSADETLDLLNQYLGKGIPLQIGYADTNGSVTLRVIDPISISYGTLVARDHLTNGVTPFKIARITGVALA